MWLDSAFAKSAMFQDERFACSINVLHHTVHALDHAIGRAIDHVVVDAVSCMLHHALGGALGYALSIMSAHGLHNWDSHVFGMQYSYAVITST